MPFGLEGESKGHEKGSAASFYAQVGGLVGRSKWPAPLNAFGFRPDVILVLSCNAHPSIHYRRSNHPSIHPSVPSISPRSRGYSHFAKQSSFPFITSSTALLSFSICLLYLCPLLLRRGRVFPFISSETLRLQLVSFALLPPRPLWPSSSLFSPVSLSSSRPTGVSLSPIPSRPGSRVLLFLGYLRASRVEARKGDVKAALSALGPRGRKSRQSHWP